MHIPTKKTILLVTDLSNEDSNEDDFFISYLKKNFIVKTTLLKNVIKLATQYDCTVFKNAWSDISSLDELIEYRKLKKHVLQYLKQNNITTYNSLDGRGDTCGKEYLMELQKANYPIIPTYETITDVLNIPSEKHVFLKPYEGLSSYGALLKPSAELSTSDFDNYIVQQHINFLYEVSFYYIDNIFQYALYAPNPKQRWELQEYNPSEEDLQWAEKFVQWNTLSYGLQRIDACRDGNGSLLLMEIEDDYPLWSVLDLPESTRNKVLTKFLSSLQAHCFNT